MKGLVSLPIAKGRRELAYFVGFGSAAGAAPANIQTAVTISPDADFVVNRIWVQQFGGANTALLLPDGCTIQLQDGASSLNLNLQPSDGQAAYFTPSDNPSAAGIQAWRSIRIPKQMACPYLLRAASSVFINIANPYGKTFSGDVMVILEGFRVYSGSPDPIPAKITGMAFPYYWNGSLILPAAPSAAGFQKVGSIVMSGPGGSGKYILKTAAANLVAAGGIAGGAGVAFLDRIGIQIRDSQYQSKNWVQWGGQVAPTVGEFMPLSILTCGFTSEAWVYPRFMGGTATITADIFFDSSSITGNYPLKIGLEFEGVYIP